MKKVHRSDLYEQKVIPAIRNMKSFERFLEGPLTYGIFLELHVAQLRNVFKLSNACGKKMYLHADLIQGLRSDEYGVEFITQEVNPCGIISTRGNVIQKAKQKKITAVQRIFLLDSHALEKNIALIEKTSPDYVEVLPGIVPTIIQETAEIVDSPILAGGFITGIDDINRALDAGASAVTTSKVDLWKQF